MKLPDPILSLITDRKRFGEERLPEIVSRAVDGGVNLVQLREKDLPAEALTLLASELRRVTRGRALLVVNGPPEIARSVGADGIHLPEPRRSTFPVLRSAFREERSRCPLSEQEPLHVELGTWNVERGLVGRSVHDVEGAREAARGGADYLQAGHVFETASHPGEPPRGTEWLRDVCRAVSVPVIAVGGVTAGNVGACIRAGARGVAVISAIGTADDPRSAAQEMWEALVSALPQSDAKQGLL